MSAKDDKDSFKLHCALIVAQDGDKKTDAPWKAWQEGPAGLRNRLLGKTLAPEAEQKGTAPK